MTAVLPAVSLAVLGALGLAEAPFRSIAFDAAVEAAKAEKKVVMVDFYTTWCGPCRQLDAITWKDEKVRAWLEAKTVPLKLDAEVEVDLAGRFRVRGYPTILFVDRTGAEVGRVLGFLPPAKFLERVDRLGVAVDPVERARRALDGREENPRLRQAYGRALAEAGRGEEALRELLWCFDHGVEASAGYAGDRGSFLVLEIALLARDHPPAREALLARREALAEAVLAGREAGGDAALVARIDRALGRDEESLAFLDAMSAADADGAGAVDLGRSRRELCRELFETLVRLRRYGDALAGQEDLRATVARKIEELERARERSRKTVPRRVGPPIGRVADLEAEVGNLARRHYEPLLGAGRDEDAAWLVETVLADLRSGELCAALVDAAARAGRPEAGTALAAEWLERLPPEERAVVREAAERLATTK